MKTYLFIIQDENKKIKTGFFFLFLLPLCVVLLGTGCKKDNIQPDPAKAILGKWELVAIQPYNQEEEKYKPTGYIEYLPDSTMAWYGYATKNREVLKGRYWFETNSIDGIEKNQTILHYDLIRTEEPSQSEYMPSHENDFECHFQNSMMMLFPIGDFLVPPPTFIYKHKR